jgi:hypothetical protein
MHSFFHCATFTCYTKASSHFCHIASYLPSLDLCLALHVMDATKVIGWWVAGWFWCVTQRKLRPNLNFDPETHHAFLIPLYTYTTLSPCSCNGNVCAVQSMGVVTQSILFLYLTCTTRFLFIRNGAFHLHQLMHTVFFIKSSKLLQPSSDIKHYYISWVT